MAVKPPLPLKIAKFLKPFLAELHIFESFETIFFFQTKSLTFAFDTSTKKINMLSANVRVIFWEK